ncbi:hypothetical protein P7B02_10135 [Caulobacter segnis]|uniref:hypothetical protein n=1 Tax=Caulobacter segnis TaxID=88688 RepID=UPI00241042E5|nr:hypothetical protein [Caulobacter segnis]MDG2521902.1 hypothetical protein [Caulobacter segnis]
MNCRTLSPGAPAAATLFLFACSAPEERPAVPPPAPVAQEATVGGDGSAIQLNGLSSADVEANRLSGELGCSFAATGASQPLLLAMGDVASKEAAQGLVKVGDYVERVAVPGGFDGMLKGAVFSGAGKTIRVTLTGPASGGGESPPSPATLTYDRADGASRTWVGSWTCGP